MVDTNFLIGGDPEFPIFNKKTKEYITAENLVKGSKNDPFPIAIEGCFEQLDCVGIEFTLPPAPVFWVYYDIIQKCVEHTNKSLQKVNKNYTLVPVSSAIYGYEQLYSESANTFGCDPSYSIYRNGVSERPTPLSVGKLRTFGFHIHYGWEKEYNKEDLLDFIILNDIFIGIPSLFLDKDVQRRSMYGNLSDHRIITKDKIDYDKIEKSNRVEYRSLGTAMFNFPDIIDQGIDNIKRVILNKEVKDIIKYYYNDLKEIDQSNFDMKLCEDLKNKLIKNNHFTNEQSVSSSVWNS